MLPGSAPGPFYADLQDRLELLNKRIRKLEDGYLLAFRMLLSVPSHLEYDNDASAMGALERAFDVADDGSSPEILCAFGYLRTLRDEVKQCLRRAVSRSDEGMLSAAEDKLDIADATFGDYVEDVKTLVKEGTRVTISLRQLAPNGDVRQIPGYGIPQVEADDPDGFQVMKEILGRFPKNKLLMLHGMTTLAEIVQEFVNDVDQSKIDGPALSNPQQLIVRFALPGAQGEAATQHGEYATAAQSGSGEISPHGDGNANASDTASGIAVQGVSSRGADYPGSFFPALDPR